MDHWFVILCFSAFVGYLFGSIPFGLIITKFAGMGDVRDIGSGNIGATNVLRTGKKPLAALTLAADIFKGFLPTLLISNYFDLIPFGIIAGFMALIGHMFPIWLKFKGGKGVATYIGVAFGFFWPSGLSFIVIWLLMAVIFRYSSLSALVACLLTPLITFFMTEEIIATTLFVMSILVLIRHRSNIERLITGEEDKIGQKQTS